MEQKRLKPWVGVLFLGIVLAMAQFVCFPIQGAIGLWGLAITELILLVMAIAAALICKQNLKEVFPMKLPKLREVLGVLVFWMGGILATLMASYIFMLFFPEEMAAVSGGLNDIVSSEGLLLGILIASVMPAICEEAVHRGFILHTFKGVKKPWVIVLSMGILFGVFHLDFYRFLPTAILGACITWVMLKTENMVMPALYHGINNLVPVLLSVVLQDTIASVTSETAEGQGAMIAEQLLQGGVPLYISSIGTYLLLGVVAFPLMLAGTALMKKKGEKIKGKHVVTVFIIAGACFLIGMIMLIGASAYMISQGTINVGL